MTLLEPRGVVGALLGAGLSRAPFEEWDAALRAPLSTGRRVGFLAFAPGVGTTTLAYEASRVAASRRAQPVLAVDVSGSPAGLAARLGAAPTPPRDERALARTSAEATAGLATGTHGQYVLHPDRPAGEAVAAWVAEASPIARFFDVVVTDFGVRHPAEDFASCAALCDVVCIVAPGDRVSAELALSLAVGLGDLPESPSVVLGLVDRARTAAGAPAVVAAHAPGPVVSIPRDIGLERQGHPRSLAARAALLGLAAALIAPARAAA